MSLTLHTFRYYKASTTSRNQVVGDACANNRGNENPAFETVANLLMPDGSVMSLSANDNQTWVKLTPDIYGSYVNGTWSTVGKMNIPRLYFASQVLPDGRLWVTGGEYTGPYYDPNITGSGEIYDPTTNTWSWNTNFPICQPGPRTVNVTSDVVLTSGSPTVSGIYSTDRIQPGWTITGAGIPASTTVVSVDSPTQVTMSNSATS